MGAPMLVAFRSSSGGVEHISSPLQQIFTHSIKNNDGLRMPSDECDGHWLPFLICSAR
jgi:hypothetical protein